MDLKERSMMFLKKFSQWEKRKKNEKKIKRPPVWEAENDTLT
jgi:hypothetical protein